MHLALDSFRDAIAHATALDAVHKSLSSRVTAALDTTDILRAQIVLGVSALDHYIHELAIRGMLQIYDGTRPPCPGFLRYKVSLELAVGTPTRAIDRSLFEAEIRERNGLLSFQQPEKIADAIRTFSSIELWERVGKKLHLLEQALKNQLELIVKRRNQIAHEADIIPSYVGAKLRWPITENDVSVSIQFIEDLCVAIHAVIL